MTSRYDYGSSGYGGGYGSGSGGREPPSSGYRYGSDATGQQPERGARRKKLAAMAGSLYRAGAAAASEIKEQYNNTRIRNVEPYDSSSVSIPGSFPHVSIIHNGEEQMLLFPSYAKRHVRLYGNGNNRGGNNLNSACDTQMQHGGGNAVTGAMNDGEYWRHEWAKAEDEKAVVDVDVRGWIYMPSRGPMTRRNRMLIALARRLSGIPAPTLQPDASASEQERIREERRIAREAQEIERRGQSEREAAHRGEYSEKPAAADEDCGPELDRTASKRSGTHTNPNSPPGSPALLARPSFTASELSDMELSTANANLMARIGPFMTTPLVNLPITVFFYNDEQSQSRTVETNDSGHFTLRAPLDFVPTHVRVLVNENISATQPVQIIEPKGISLISDIDDTVKRSNISLGAREIFRNTFIRDLADLTIEGVKEWYNSLHNMGIKVHYCSNSPWQLFPVLATFFHTAGLPPGSIHLKQYSGMLQGIFEPVAERKKGTLERILRDFPERRFLLVGDSGEADLEVYTELAVAHPGRILAVFIRDVTTPELTQFFDSGFNLDGEGKRVQRTNTIGSARVKFEEQQTQQTQQRSGSLRPDPPSRIASAPSRQQQLPTSGSAVGTLIDFSDEPEDISPTDTRKSNPSGASSSAVDLLAGTAASKKPPPPRPVKPKALRSSPSDLSLRTENARNTAGSGGASPSSGSPHPLTQVSSLPSRQGSGSGTPPAPPPPRRRGTGTTNSSSSSLQREDKILPPPPPPQRRTTNLNSSTSNASQTSNYRRHGIANVASGGSGGGYGGGGSDAVNKKLELWHRRLARAHEILDEQGVPLYTWRRGEDVIKEAEGIVKEALRGMGLLTPGGQNGRKLKKRYF
ncbi:putative actin patch protein 1 [Naviculisporaceae sp. PSN 640]